ncbi:nitrate reductase molybdenum cofactor assembly chaperone [Halalkalibacterium halodurans]|jgi:nitrate reductase delta subunit|uniref:Nitrate reductase n=1 Tax=Halalkalibacterium halodurans TaxID=86665 RepID=A0A0M0KDB3_ALKHA|nr:nitrate reductase molybdenum cofactor assembly chaperone [Halalkalibacterium halodurans]MDY7220737.1 nitrate reductase molybdenum cofactor assembly chaperone [Halalkalibacterium halodurans]MDY7239976.1 nitrate reductase molybdenum cofactor assembly chaperone [Halalkalibacterium halodurans]MED4164317.1 nitrate reductase molybdenum cofactor assembly chaperone [Halalkalibacterium halodurans]TPE67377.1 nitrate reductase molybdenum cofactor assembly chaperone [Halalkalibacterium halodurans]
METIDRTIVFSALSYLLSYPDEQWRQVQSEWQEIIGQVQHQTLRKHLQTFLEKASTYTQDELIERYVSTFDFGKKTNLYVTYFHTGEQRERGLELLQLKDLYQRSGFEPTAKELPDFLPLMLEFAALSDKEQITAAFENYLLNLGELRSRLSTGNSLYTVLLDAVLLALSEVGVEGTVLQ